VEEAGGKISDLDGNPYVLGGKSILATNGLIHTEMEQVATEIAKKEALQA
jgi:myo-inositol-1(or 4)-monophosphatase